MAIQTTWHGRLVVKGQLVSPLSMSYHISQLLHRDIIIINIFSVSHSCSCSESFTKQMNIRQKDHFTSGLFEMEEEGLTLG